MLNAKVIPSEEPREKTLELSEGDLVRSTNDLYKSYGVGYIQKIRGEQAKVEFNPSVFMQPPYRSENKILHWIITSGE